MLSAPITPSTPRMGRRRPWNKIVGQASEPDDIVLIDRDCHKSHHYACVLSGAQPVYLDAFPLTQYSMYGSVPIRTIKRALSELKAEGRLDRVKVLILTNATFDGHMANVARTMEECLAIKPDLVFLWDEAWSAFARFTPLLRWRTAMSGAAHLRANRSNPKYRQRYQEFAAQGIEMDINDPRALDERLMPDPDQMRVRVYQTTSVHKSMSALRQASLISVADDDYGDVEEAFHEADFTHTSTSPNLQIIASLDVARRQMGAGGGRPSSRPEPLSWRSTARPYQRQPSDRQDLPSPHSCRHDSGAIPTLRHREIQHGRRRLVNRHDRDGQ